MELQQYPFDTDFQIKIVALMLREPGFLRDYREAIKPEWFDKLGLEYMARITTKYFDQRGEVPTPEVLFEETRRFCTKRRMEEEEFDLTMQWARQTAVVAISDAGYVKEKTLEFAQHQAYRHFLAEGANVLMDPRQIALDMEKLKEDFEKIVRIGDSLDDFGHDFGRELPGTTAMMRSDQTYSRKIVTPFFTLNKATLGGFGRGQVIVVMARPGVGKSWFAMNCAAAALLQGCNVVHYSIGDLKEQDVHIRYAMKCLAVTQDDIVKNSELYQQRLSRYKSPGRLWIKYFSPGITSIHRVAAHLDRLVDVEKMIPDMVVLDYPDQLKGAIKESMYAAVGDIYDQIIAMGDKYKAVMLVPSQVKREWDGDIITKESIANSDLKSAKADIMVSLNQNAAERKAETMRLFVDKCRRGITGDLIDIQSEFARGTMRQAPKPEGGSRLNVPVGLSRMRV